MQQWKPLNDTIFKMKKLLIILILYIPNTFFGQNVNDSSSLKLMPWPKEIKQFPGKFLIDKDFSVSINSDDKGRVHLATTKFLRRLSEQSGIFLNKDFPEKNVKDASLLIHFNEVAPLSLGIDESYLLTIDSQQIQIQAKTDIGAMHALQTLLQLLSFNKTSYYFPNINIKDAPRFAWRGLLIDVGRHFQPVTVIKRNLDAMAFVKMNVFHWHLSEDQGFRVEVKSRPKLHELASDGLYYTQSQIKDIVKYADNLGIRVVPEFDIPGHATSWLVAYPEMASKEKTYKTQRFAGVFDPTLDPTKEITYQILDDVFSEMATLFPDVYFHIGGDENEGKHWDENKKIQAFMKKNGFKTHHDLQTYFNIRVQKILKKNHKIMMGWDEIFQPDLPKDVVIHSWRGKESMIKAAKKGYKTVLSKGFYIDLLLSVNHHYKNDPLKDNYGLTEKESKNILGGEATMWGELVTPLTIDSRIWPRTAAIAERLWSAKEVRDIPFMRKRLKAINLDLEKIGITHIRNRDVILRNIAESEEILSLQNLTKIYEPLKGYTRNKGGTEYKTFSPFTLFADACTADAEDAYSFHLLVDDFVKNPSKEKQQKIILYLDKWIKNDFLFQRINNNPKTAVLENASKNLKEIAILIKKGFDRNFINHSIKKSASLILTQLKKPVADTELMIIKSLETLVNYLNKK